LHKFVINNNAYEVDSFGNGAAFRYTGANSTTTGGGTAGSLGTNTINISNAIAIGDPFVIDMPIFPPEPGGLGLLGVATAALLRRRHRKC
jgi:hypothetical protein